MHEAFIPMRFRVLRVRDGVATVAVYFEGSNLVRMIHVAASVAA